MGYRIKLYFYFGRKSILWPMKAYLSLNTVYMVRFPRPRSPIIDNVTASQVDQLTPSISVCHKMTQPQNLHLCSTANKLTYFCLYRGCLLCRQYFIVAKDSSSSFSYMLLKECGLHHLTTNAVKVNVSSMFPQ